MRSACAWRAKCTLKRWKWGGSGQKVLQREAQQAYTRMYAVKGHP